MTERAFILVSGDDRVSFLQGLLTQDVTKLAPEALQFAALLSPQGKLLHDMFLLALPDAILIDTGAADAPTLLKRLTMYKLRAKVTLAWADWHVTTGTRGLPDPRHPALPHRQYAEGPATSQPTADAWQAARLAHGIPELGVDMLPDSITAMDAGYELLHGISFNKGCYVGQEVTARMHYKAIARKGFFRVRSLEPLADGAALTVDGKTIGTLSSAQGDAALAFLKFDDAIGTAVSVDGHPVTLTAPEWLQPKLAQFHKAGQET